MRAACGLIVLLLVTSSAGCSDSKPKFAIVGDSITNLIICHHDIPSFCRDGATTEANGRLKGAMGDGYRLSARATDGRRIDQMLGDATSLADGKPDVFAVNLGSNDAIQGNADWQASFDQLLAVALPARCVILTTVATNAGHHPRPLAVAMNSFIASTMASHPNVRVVDWDAAVKEHKDEFTSDELHPTTVAGQVWLSKQYRAAADSCG